MKISNFKESLIRVKGMVFDVDGVLSADVSPLDEHGDPARTASVKDGLAIRSAIRQGFSIGIITGGCATRVKLRYQKLGVELYYDNVKDKISSMDDFVRQTGIQAGEILFMGDDLVDFGVMKVAGIATCPADAVPEIKAIADYISDKNGGHGCVRDVIEQVMRAQGKWFGQGELENQAI